MPQAKLSDIKADTVTAELKTNQDKLSVWIVDNENDLEDAFIALGSNCENICTITAVKVADEDVKTLTIDDEEGNTPTIGINQKHRNLRDLSYVSLGTVISSLIHGFNNGGYVRRTRKEMRATLKKAYMDGKLDFPKLQPTMQKEIMKAISNE